MKIIIDHVIDERADRPRRCRLPRLRAAAARAAARREPARDPALAARGAGRCWCSLIGAIGSTAAEVDRTEGTLSSRARHRDHAPRTRPTSGYSFAGGLLGLLEFRFTLRLTQALNHHYRSRVFERIQALPMTRVRRRAHRRRGVSRDVRHAGDHAGLRTACSSRRSAAVLGLLVTVWAVYDTVEREPGHRLGGARLPAARARHDPRLRRARARAGARQPRGRRDHDQRDRGGLRQHPRGPEPRQRGPPARSASRSTSWASFGAFRRLVLTPDPRHRVRRAARGRADGLRLRAHHRPRDRRRPHAPATSRWSSPTSSRSPAMRWRSACCGSSSRARPPASAASSS